MSDEPRDVKDTPPPVRDDSAPSANPRLASQLVQQDGTLKCATCGSTQFSTKRSTERKLLLGPWSLLGSANQVQCLGCGKIYARR